MITLNCSDDVKVISCGLQLLVQQSDGPARLLDVPRPATPAKQEQQEAGARRVTCVAVSPCRKLVVAGDEYKQVCVWRLGEQITLELQQSLPRRPSCVAFTGLDGAAVLVADKSGDVFSVEKDREPRLLLGHLSQLLALQLDPAGRFLITADRDEKIRVSRYPNSYNIHGYCLGHTEFVTCLALSAATPTLLLSGAGDGRVATWCYTSCTLLTSRQVAADVECGAVRARVEPEVEGGARRVDPPAQPAVVSLKMLGCVGCGELFVVQVEGYQGLVMYRLEGGTGAEGGADIKLVQRLPLPPPASCLLDFDTNNGELQLLVQTEDKSVLLQTYTLNDANLLSFAGSVGMSNPQVGDFFQPIANFESDGLANLHKRWFDNVKDYLERKEARINKLQALQTIPEKKQKLET